MRIIKSIERKLDFEAILVSGCILAILLVILFVPVEGRETDGRLRILYYDPHYRDYPSPLLIRELELITQPHEFKVYLGEEARVVVLKDMMMYDIVLIYGHGARVNDTGVFVWTGELWSEAKENNFFPMFFWLLQREVALGIVNVGNETRYYLALSPLWFEKELENRDTHKTIVVYIGCNTFDENLARTLIKKGAMAYIGTTSYIPPSIADELVLNITRILLDDRPLLEKLYIISKMKYIGVYTILDYYQI